MYAPREIFIALLTILFALYSLALLTALLYVLWRKKIFQQHNITTHENTCHVPSKELIYFFCWKTNQSSRVEPSSTPPPSAPPEDVLAKWQQDMYGPCRAGESEGSNQFSDRRCNSLTKHKWVSSENCFQDSKGLSSEAVVVDVDDDDDDDDATFFSTPCASPPYYTPSPSPTHDDCALLTSESVTQLERSDGAEDETATLSEMEDDGEADVRVD